MVDSKDGFDYTIEIKERFAAVLAEFVSGVKGAQDVLEVFKDIQAQTSETNKSASDTLKQASKAAREAADANNELAASGKKAKQQLTVQEQAVLDNAKALRKQAVEAEKERQADALDIPIKKKKKKELDNVSKAVNELEKDQQRQRINALKSEIAEASGIETMKAKARRLKEATAAARDAAKAFNAQAAAQERINRADEEAQVASILKARGRAPSGALLPGEVQGPPIPPTSDFQGPEQDKIEARALAVKEAQAEKEQLRLRLARENLDLQGKQIKAVSEEGKIQDRTNKILERRKLIQASNAQLASQGLSPTGAPLPESLTLEQQAAMASATRLQSLEMQVLQKRIEDANPRYKELRKELGATASVGNRVAFTFRRLFGIFAAFTAVRLFVAQLKEAVTGSIEFNSQIEQSTLGITSLLLSTAKVETVMGKATTATESYALAQAEARRQVALLRQENLRNAATLPQLLRAYQSALAPGLNAGLSTDQVRKFSSSLSKAATAIGLPQEQLPEEVRSLLQGTISKRNTRIATTLNISNEDIKRAKEIGDLFGFLERKFAAFEKTADEGLKTFSVRLSNAKDSVQGLLAAGFEDFFTKLSDLLDLVTNKLVKVGDKFQINPGAVRVVEILGTVLSYAVEQARHLIEAFSSKDVEATFTNLAFTLKLVIGLASIFIESLFKGLAIVAKPLAVIENILSNVASVFGEKSRTVLVTLLSWVVALKTVSYLLGGLPSMATKLVVELIKAALVSKAVRADFEGLDKGLKFDFLLGNLKGILVAAGSFLKRWGVVAALIAFTAEMVSKIKDKQEELTHATLSWWNSLKGIVMELGLLERFIIISFIDGFDTIFKYIGAGIASMLIGVLGILSTFIEKVSSSFLTLIPGFDKVVAKIKDGIDGAVASLKEYESTNRAVAGRSGGWWERTKDGLTDVKYQTLAYVRTLEEAAKPNVDLVSSIEELPSIIGNSTKGMEALVEKSENLKNELEAARDAMYVASKTTGADGAIQQQARALAESLAKLDKEDRAASGQVAQAKADQLRLSKDALAIQEKVSALSSKDKETYDKIGAAARNILEVQHALEVAKEKGATAVTPEERSAGKEQAALLEDRLTKLKEQANHILDSVPNSIQKDLTNLALSEITNAGLQLDAQRKVNEALQSYADLRKEIMDVAEAKIITIGLEEYNQIQNRIKATQLEAEAARRLIAVRLSGNQNEEQLATSQNDIDRQKLELEILKQHNQENQKALGFIRDKFQGTQLYFALQKLLNLEIIEGDNKELAAANEISAATAARTRLIRQQKEAHEDNLRSLKNEVIETQAQVAAQRDLLSAKFTRDPFDDRKAQAKAEIVTQKNKIQTSREDLQVAIERKVLEVSQATTLDERQALEQQLNALREKGLASLTKEHLILGMMNADLVEMTRLEIERQQASTLETRVRAARFNAEQGTNPQREQFVELSGNVLLEKQKLNTLQKGTVEYESQVESLREANFLLDKFVQQLDRPVREGFMEGMKQFIKQAPTDFDLSVSVMKQSLEGLAQVGADSLTAIFDPRNTTSFQERLGELALSIGNTIFKGLLDQLISQSIQSLFPELAKGSALTGAAVALEAASAPWFSVIIGLNEAAIALEAAAASQGGASVLSSLALANGDGAPLGKALGGPVHGYARGGRRKLDPRDTVPAMLRKGEYVLRPEAVSVLGLSMLDQLNAVQSPEGLEQIAALGVGSRSTTRPTAPEKRPAASGAATGRSAQPAQPVRALMVPTEQDVEMLLAAGDGAMQRYLTARGYHPTRS